MRAVQFLFIISLGLLIGACGKDEDRICTQEDFFGVYKGSTVCANGGATDSAIGVTSGGSDTELRFDVGGSIFNVTIDGCNFSGTQKDSNVDLEYSGNLSGDKIEVTLKGLVFMVPFDCTASGKRQ